jgi:hypothetical protein
MSSVSGFGSFSAMASLARASSVSAKASVAETGTFRVDYEGFRLVARSIPRVRQNREPANLKPISDDQIPSYSNAYNPLYEQIEVPSPALEEMADLNAQFSSMTGKNREMIKWAESPEYANFAKWYKDTFKPAVEKMLAKHPEGIFLKDMSMSPKDVWRDKFDAQAKKEAKERAAKQYPHWKVDEETIRLFEDQVFFEMCAIKSVEEATEYLLRSDRMQEALDTSMSVPHPYFVLIRPHDKRIIRACEKRVAVIKVGACRECIERNWDSDNPPPMSHRCVQIVWPEPKVQTVTSYADEEFLQKRRVLLQTDHFPRTLLATIQKCIIANQGVYFSQKTERTYVDLSVCTNIDRFFDARASQLPSEEDTPPYFIERNPYNSPPKILTIISNIDRFITKIQGVGDLVLAYVGDSYPSQSTIGLTGLNRFKSHELILWDSTINPKIRVDIRDCWANYAVARQKKNVTPVPFPVFESAYFTLGQMRRTDADMHSFYQKIREEEIRHEKLASEATTATAVVPASSCTWVDSSVAATGVDSGMSLPNFQQPSFSFTSSGSTSLVGFTPYPMPSVQTTSMAAEWTASASGAAGSAGVNAASATDA